MQKSTLWKRLNYPNNDTPHTPTAKLIMLQTNLLLKTLNCITDASNQFCLVQALSPAMHNRKAYCLKLSGINESVKSVIEQLGETIKNP